MTALCLFYAAHGRLEHGASWGAAVNRVSITEQGQPITLERHGIQLDPVTGEVHRDGRRVALRRKEFCVLEQLLAADGRAVSVDQLLCTVWHEHTDPFTNVIRVTVMNLRRRLGGPPVIETITGVGYQIR